MPLILRGVVRVTPVRDAHDESGLHPIAAMILHRTIRRSVPIATRTRCSNDAYSITSVARSRIEVGVMMPSNVAASLLHHYGCTDRYPLIEICDVPVPHPETAG